MNYGRKSLKKAQKRQEIKVARVVRALMWNSTLSVVTVMVSVCLISVFFMFGVLNGIFQSSPGISTLDVVPDGYATVIYDTNGKKITQLVAEDSNRSYVNGEQISHPCVCFCASTILF